MAKQLVTRFIVTSTDSHPNSPYCSDEDITSSPCSTESELESDLHSIDGIEIGEGFLAGSLSSTLSGGLFGAKNAISLESTGGAIEADGQDLPKRALIAQSLPKLIPSSLSRKGDDPESFIHVSSGELGKTGIFSGDWAVATIDSEGSSRLVRVLANDHLHYRSLSSVAASPVLLHNLAPSASDLQLILQPTPFGDRVYQPLFLIALKEYFESQVRLVKLGDLIAIGLKLEDSRRISDEVIKIAESSDEEHEATEGQEDVVQFTLNQNFPLSSPVNTGVVYFKITNIEHDVVDIDISERESTYFASTMGELGCWVDSKVTKMVQAGLEHSRVPDVTSYLGIESSFVPLPASVDEDLSDTPFKRLVNLVSAALVPSASDLDLSLTVLLKGARGIGKQTTALWVAQKLGIHILEVNCFEVLGETDVKTEGTLRARVEKAASCSPCIFLLRHLEALARNTQTLETGREPPMATILQDCVLILGKSWKETGYPVFLFGTTSEPEKIPQGVLSCFKHEIQFESPNEAERLEILHTLLQSFTCTPDVNIKSLASQTAALVARDLVDLVQRAQLKSLQRTTSSLESSNPVHLYGSLVLTAADFDVALNDARSSFSESIGAPKIPNVTWDDVGGLASVKSDILDTIQLPLEYPELFADGLKKRSGILLYGPPGTGKTLLAKAVATSCSLNFFSVKGPELLNMYIGESEANVRRVFQRARDAKPCVIFFDELDSVAPKRGNHGDSGGVMDRIVSQLLAELDGMADGKGGADVFVIGATNRPDLLDPALLRPGRFDRMLYLGVSDTHEAQLNIIKAVTRKFRLDPDLDLADIAEQCPFNFTGADFYALCSDAMLRAMARKAEEVDRKIADLNAEPPPFSHPHPLTPQYYLAELATPEEIDVLVSRKDFELALRGLVPSVSQGEMEHYKAVQRRFARETINTVQSATVQPSTRSAGVPSEPQFQITEDDSDLYVAVQRTDKGKGKAKAEDIV
ncbi:P-loop containing nucleoside triphosphate hydrolase protein [Cantharellus anzutake]|uniref:P-loop containing nucleoside triphosphate hydrolase protein n=1 Tax=Cantharellus anzutake TaxID=1750568 RepID=UPI001906877A|nr:P-loop containing nucleoside triphosphate hydrolase protein [Cantharellus anzutake]KAF8334192.1 P-loop containing nucleoside triphosphate hydrolase protein [Cantharellus anzutake]